MWLGCNVSQCLLNLLGPIEFSDLKYTLVSPHVLLHSLWTQEQDRLHHTFFSTWFLNTVSCLSLSGCFTWTSSDLTVCLSERVSGGGAVPPLKRCGRQNISSASHFSLPVARPTCYVSAQHQWGAPHSLRITGLRCVQVPLLVSSALGVAGLRSLTECQTCLPHLQEW